MVICIVAAVVFGVLGIFSAKYRLMAKESFKCVFRKMTLRPCDMGLERRIKMNLVTRALKYSPRISRFTYKNFEMLSWVFVILMFGSLFYTAQGAYNLVVYGTCDPITGECLFNPGYIPPEFMHTSHILNSSFVEFYGAECLYSQKMVETVEAVELDTGIVFEKLETWYNPENIALYYKYINTTNCDSMAETRKLGKIITPVFYATNSGEQLCGEVRENVLKDFVLRNR
jgi:hypothetical protein